MYVLILQTLIFTDNKYLEGIKCISKYLIKYSNNEHSFDCNQQSMNKKQIPNVSMEKDFLFTKTTKKNLLQL